MNKRLETRLLLLHRRHHHRRCYHHNYHRDNVNFHAQKFSRLSFAHAHPAVGHYHVILSHYHVKREVIHTRRSSQSYTGCRWRLVLTFKLATSVYKIRQSGSPSYLASLLSDVRPVRGVRSTSSLALQVTGCRLKTSERAFSHSAVAAWNSLRSTVVECGTVGAFRKQLKTNLYDVAYKTIWAVAPRPRMASPHSCLTIYYYLIIHTSTY